MKKFDPLKNYQSTKKTAGYVERKKAVQADYDRIGFMSGLEVHQQLLTKEKLFCHCPAGQYQKHDDYDAEVIRHMRPTLSELGEYDGTALMEFKTRKEITYRLKNETACTYEVDDTPPFPINRDALEIALKISLLSKLNIVGEVHITRKQYLDGSIPTGFQRTAILGVEGEIPLKNKIVKLIQLSIEEDSCREVSDIRHQRIYRTDRLGMPLIETVTYPDMVNPDEVKEACDYIRFLNRSTGLVRTGIGAGRQDVNVSCRGGTRVEIKGVSHSRWIPELTHVEAYRQWALLQIQKEIKARIAKADWKMNSEEINYYLFQLPSKEIDFANEKEFQIFAVNLPKFNKILSHFTQPGKVFADEITDRLKVIACLEEPNMTDSESQDIIISEDDFNKIRKILKADNDDAQLVFWGPKEDIKTAFETIEERCLMAFDGVPPETRKSFENGTTIFERVLPGADRMYPDTDSAPIPLANDYIENLNKDLPSDVIERYNQLKEWGVSEDTYAYLFTNNLFPLILEIKEKLNIDPKYMGNFLGYRLKFIEGHFNRGGNFKYKLIFNLFKYLIDKKIELEIAEEMLKLLFEHPKMQFDSVLIGIKFKKVKRTQILDQVHFLKEKFKQIGINQNSNNAQNWIMGQLRKLALGNIALADLQKEVNLVCKRVD
ncbi:MAG: Glu-tRNA(Gln) amidotransferase subunit GatE [Bacteroidales bacterium]|jgi:glutamyl-tRNA(Gln) amidotransferase subunit E|nr:Glu-tRNA(Gln) amidotransferase subunit GatE [Bacteroidales bacterium]